MEHNFKTPMDFKLSYYALLLILAVSIYTSHDIGVAVAVLGWCILTTCTYILKAIHDLKHNK